jgi:cold shock CspA family protein
MINMIYIGVVLNYFKSKGYGWLESPDHISTYFHISDVPGRKILSPGTSVSYELATDEKDRVRAVNLSVLASTHSASAQNGGSVE